MSKITLDKPTISTLAMDWNILVAPRKITNQKVTFKIEITPNTLENVQVEEIRLEVGMVLKKEKQAKSRRKRLNKNEDVLVLPADKGNATFVRNQEERNQKIKELLKDTIY